MRAKVKELFDQEFGSRFISKQLNVSRKIIQNIYKELNLNTKNKLNPRKVYLLKEKYCKFCLKNKSIDGFRKRINSKTKRVSYESICLNCEKLYNHKRLKVSIKNKLKTNITFKLKSRMSFLIYNNLKSNNLIKNQSCIKYVNYSIQELKAHLESLFETWMNWSNYGVYRVFSWNDKDSSTWTWQIDHIIPQSILKYESYDSDNFKKCWNLINLRPYSSKQNLLDGVNKLRHNIIY